MKTIFVLCLTLRSSIGLSAEKVKPPPPQPSCDRECLRGATTQVLHSLAEHNTATLPVSPTLRVTEAAVEKSLDKVALIRSVTKLRGYRKDVIDERAGVAVAGVMVEEAGAAIMLVVRAKMDADQKNSELELVTTRSRADGMIAT